MAPTDRVRISTLLRIASYALTIVGVVVIVTLGSGDDRRKAAAWLSRGSMLVLGAVVLSAINIWVSRRRL